MSTHARSPAELSTLKTISIVLAFTAAVGLTLGTAGFSAIDADRGIEVSVVDDESAYLGVNETAETLVENKSSTVAVYENGFDTELDEFSVNVVSTVPNVDATVVDAPESLDAGESAHVDVVVESEDVDLDSVELRLEVATSGEGVTVETSRTDEFDLISGDDIEVVFRGGGNAKIRGPPGVFPLDVEVDTADGDTVELEITESGQTIRDGNVTGGIETVRIPGFGIEQTPK